MGTGIGIAIGTAFSGRRSDEPGVYRPASASIVYTGQTPSLIVDRVLSPASAGITYAGQTPSVSVVTTLSPASASISYAGQAPTVTAANAPDRADIMSAFFGSSENGVWYDLSDTSTLWQDTSKTVAADANGDPVLRIDDISGNGNTMSNVTLPGVYYDGGVNTYFAYTGTYPSTTGSVGYLNMTGMTNIDRTNMCGGAIMTPRTTDVAYAGLIAMGDVGASKFDITLEDAFLQAFNGAFVEMSSLYPTQDMVLTWRSNGSDWLIRANGVEYAHGSALSAGNINRVGLGTLSGGGQIMTRAKEFMLRAGDIGSSGLADLESYLMSRVPARNAAKTLHVIGDSLSMGAGSETGRPYWDRLTGLGDYTVYTYPDSGSAITVNYPVSAATVAGQKGATDAIAVVFLGVNDYLAYSRTGAQVEAGLATYCGTLHSAGMTVLLVNTPALHDSGAETQRLAGNSLLASNYTSYATALVDIATTLNDETDGTYYTADRLHFTDAGHAVVASAVQSAIDAL